jgi:hypothetical protein
MMSNMKSRSKSRLAVTCIAFVMAVGSWVGPSGIARAADTELDTKNDARLECYPLDKNATIKDSSTSFSWLVLVILSMLGFGGMFMNAKRSHGD